MYDCFFAILLNFEYQTKANIIFLDSQCSIKWRKKITHQVFSSRNKGEALIFKSIGDSTKKKNYSIFSRAFFGEEKYLLISPTMKNFSKQNESSSFRK